MQTGLNYANAVIIKYKISEISKKVIISNLKFNIINRDL